MKEAVVAAFKASENPPPATLQKALTDLVKELTSLAGAGGDNALTTALTQYAAETAKVASDADPANAMENANYLKASADLAAACKAAGVTLKI
jgi:hypothetical protein